MTSSLGVSPTDAVFLVRPLPVGFAELGVSSVVRPLPVGFAELGVSSVVRPLPVGFAELGVVAIAGRRCVSDVYEACWFRNRGVFLGACA